MSAPGNIPAEPATSAAAMLRSLREDIEQDMSNLERAPFDARHAAAAFGHLAAQVDACASVLLLVLTGERP